MSTRFFIYFFLCITVFGANASGQTQSLTINLKEKGEEFIRYFDFEDDGGLLITKGKKYHAYAIENEGKIKWEQEFDPKGLWAYYVAGLTAANGTLNLTVAYKTYKGYVVLSWLRHAIAFYDDGSEPKQVKLDIPEKSFTSFQVGPSKIVIVSGGEESSAMLHSVNDDLKITSSSRINLPPGYWKYVDYDDENIFFYSGAVSAKGHDATLHVSQINLQGRLVRVDTIAVNPSDKLYAIPHTDPALSHASIFIDKHNDRLYIYGNYDDEPRSSRGEAPDNKDSTGWHLQQYNYNAQRLYVKTYPFTELGIKSAYRIISVNGWAIGQRGMLILSAENDYLFDTSGKMIHTYVVTGKADGKQIDPRYIYDLKFQTLTYYGCKTKAPKNALGAELAQIAKKYPEARNVHLDVYSYEDGWKVMEYDRKNDEFRIHFVEE